jgi:hypothetical protein
LRLFATSGRSLLVMLALFFVISWSANRTRVFRRDLLDESDNLCDDTFLDNLLRYCRNGATLNTNCFVDDWQCSPEHSSDSSRWNVSCEDDGETCTVDFPKVRNPFEVWLCHMTCSDSHNFFRDHLVIIAVIIGAVVLIIIIAAVCCCCCCGCCGCCGLCRSHPAAAPTGPAIVVSPFGYTTPTYGYASTGSLNVTA